MIEHFLYHFVVTHPFWSCLIAFILGACLATP